MSFGSAVVDEMDLDPDFVVTDDPVPTGVLPRDDFPDQTVFYPAPNSVTSKADGVICYAKPGGSYPTTATPFFAGALNYSDLNYLGTGIDRIGSCVQNRVYAFLQGPGEARVYTVPGNHEGGFEVLVNHYHLGAWVTDYASGQIPAGNDIVVWVPNDGFAEHGLEIIPYAEGSYFDFNVGFVGVRFTRG
jgi:hypothetical protein